jgi:hypothetical protein
MTIEEAMQDGGQAAQRWMNRIRADRRKLVEGDAVYHRVARIKLTKGPTTSLETAICGSANAAAASLAFKREIGAREDIGGVELAAFCIGFIHAVIADRLKWEQAEYVDYLRAAEGLSCDENGVPW